MIAVLAAWLVFLTACSGSPESNARKLEQTRKSWETTARLAAELHAKGAIPDEYVRQVRDATEQELAKTRQSAQKLSQ